MSKFKKGQTVKVINVASHHTSDCNNGDIFKVLKPDGSGFWVDDDGSEGIYFWDCDNEVELVTPKTFTKADLKIGDIATFRKGEKDTFDGKDFPISIDFCNLEDDLTHKRQIDFDIVKIERPKEYETVWTREEPKNEYTVAELEELLKEHGIEINNLKIKK